MRFKGTAVLIFIGMSSGLRPNILSSRLQSSELRPTLLAKKRCASGPRPGILSAKLCASASGLRPGILSTKLYSSLSQMNELQREEALREYNEEFVRKTNDGRVFTLDTSTLDSTQSSVRKALTAEEMKERKEWEKTRSELVEHYSASRLWRNLTPNELLLLRVAPPLLHDELKFERSGCDTPRERNCPDKIYVWEDFAKEVRSFLVPAEKGGATVDRHIDDALYYSLDDKQKLIYGDEDTYVVHKVLLRLRTAGLMKHGPRGDALVLLEPCPLLGDVDEFLFVGANKTVPILFKATHDLLVPEKASEIVLRYKSAVEEVKETQVCTADWINIGHPLAQIMNYMFVGKSRYGVLSSGTRTYFLKVEETDGDPRVHITDAWFIGQEDYLRAWSYLYNLATCDGDFQVPPGLEKKWQTWTLGGSWKHTEGRDGADGRTEGRPSTWRKGDDEDRGPRNLPTDRFMTWLDPGIAPSIPRVDGKDVEFIGYLGHGGNGVYLGFWNGKQVAVKVFDVYKALARFENEIRGYEHLKDAWGVLVPEPYFIADRFGLVLLGLELGRMPNSSDKEYTSEREMLFRTLQDDYGFVHSDQGRKRWTDDDDDSDQDPGEVIYLPDKSGTGSSHLVAIDLEVHQLICR